MDLKFWASTVIHQFCLQPNLIFVTQWHLTVPNQTAIFISINCWEHGNDYHLINFIPFTSVVSPTICVKKLNVRDVRKTNPKTPNVITCSKDHGSKLTLTTVQVSGYLDNINDNFDFHHMNLQSRNGLSNYFGKLWATTLLGNWKELLIWWRCRNFRTRMLQLEFLNCIEPVDL